MRARGREQGRGERVLPGLWRLRLPLPWPGVPHGNAWAIADGEGIVLVDTGVHEEGSLAELERAMDQVGLRLEQVHRLLITHAHNDHWGQARPVVERSGAEMWVHPAAALAAARIEDRESALHTRLEVARQSGVPTEGLRAWAERERSRPPLFAGPVERARDLRGGMRFASDLGEWHVVETPGHAASHVSLHQPEHRLLISGDHLLGRIVLWFDRGDVPDPVGDYLESLDRVESLRARLALSGHGKPFLDVPGHIAGSRRALRELRTGVLTAVGDPREPRTALEVAAALSGEHVAGAGGSGDAVWRLPITLAVLEHLELAGRVARESDGALERWRVDDAAGEPANLDTLVSR